MQFQLSVTLEQWLSPVPVLVHAVCVTLIMIVGILGNALIIHHYRRKSKRASGDMFYIALAIADLFAVIVICPQWPLPHYILKDDDSNGTKK